MVFKGKEFGSCKVFGEVFWSSALRKQLKQLGQLLCDSGSLGGGQGFEEVLHSESRWARS